MVGTVPGGPVTVAVQGLVAWQQAVERREQVRIGARTDLDHDNTGRSVRHEDRQETVRGIDISEEGLARGRQICQATAGAGPDRQLQAVYGKMLRNASRSRPRPPRAGADS